MSQQGNLPSEPLSDDALAAVTDTTVIARNPSVVAAETNGEVVMMTIEGGRYFGLDPVGTEIWNCLEPPCTFASLIDSLLAIYDVGRSIIAADTRELIARMAQLNLVKLT